MIKSKRIEALEGYIAELKRTGKIADDDLALIQATVKEEEKKIENAFNETDNAEEQKLEESQADESESTVSDPEEVSPEYGRQTSENIPSPFTLKGSEDSHLDPAALSATEFPKTEDELNQKI